MRYEKLDWELSTVACAVLLEGLGLIKDRGGPEGYSWNPIANAEIQNVANELRARLQHRDPDPQASKNQLVTLTEAVKMIKAPVDNTDLTT